MFYNVTNPGMTVEQGDILVSNRPNTYRSRLVSHLKTSQHVNCNSVVFYLQKL